MVRPRGRRGRLLGSGLAVLLLCAAGGPAEAKRRKRKGKVPAREPNEAAAQLDAMAKAAYRAKKWDDAIAGFEAAYEADPLPRFLFNLGRSHEKHGDMARASHYLERYLREYPDAEDRKKVKALVKMLRVKLRKRASRVQVDSFPGGALLEIRAKEEVYDGETPFSGWIPFGKYEVTVSLEGYETATRQVVVRPKKTAELTVELVASKVAAAAEPPLPKAQVGSADRQKPPAKPPKKRPPKKGAKEPPKVEKAPPAPEPPAAEAEPEEGPSPWAWPALGVGLAGLAAGVTFGVLARSEQSAEEAAVEEAQRTGAGKRDEILQHNEAARRWALLADVGYGVAAVGIGAGVLLLVLAGPGAEVEGEEAAVRPAVTPRWVGVAGSF